jgi:hypothetical protein
MKQPRPAGAFSSRNEAQIDTSTATLRPTAIGVPSYYVIRDNREFVLNIPCGGRRQVVCWLPSSVDSAGCGVMKIIWLGLAIILILAVLGFHFAGIVSL